MTIDADAPASALLPLLRKLGACPDSIEWIQSLDPSLTVARAWETCDRGDWMLWIAARATCVDRRKLVFATCDVAEPALRFVRASEDRPRIAIDTARRWARGEATLDEVRLAARGASAAYIASTHVAAFATDAAYAVYAATRAVAESYAASDAAAHVADACLPAACAVAHADAYATAYVVDTTAAYTAARASSLRASAAIVRSHIPLADVLRA